MDSNGLSDPYCMLCLSKSKGKCKLLESATKKRPQFLELFSRDLNSPSMESLRSLNQLNQAGARSSDHKVPVSGRIGINLSAFPKCNTKKPSKLDKTSRYEKDANNIWKAFLKSRSRKNSRSSSPEESGSQMLNSKLQFTPLIRECRTVTSSPTMTRKNFSVKNLNSLPVQKSGCSNSLQEQILMLKKAKLLQKYLMQERAQMKQTNLFPSPKSSNTKRKLSSTDESLEQGLSAEGYNNGDGVGILGPDGIMIYKTRVVPKSLCPIWNETFYLYAG